MAGNLCHVPAELCLGFNSLQWQHTGMERCRALQEQQLGSLRTLLSPVCSSPVLPCRALLSVQPGCLSSQLPCPVEQCGCPGLLERLQRLLRVCAGGGGRAVIHPSLWPLLPGALGPSHKCPSSSWSTRELTPAVELPRNPSEPGFLCISGNQACVWHVLSSGKLASHSCGSSVCLKMSISCSAHFTASAGHAFVNHSDHTLNKPSAPCNWCI